MADATSVLTRKIGPLPAWAWVGGLGAVAWFVLRGRTPATGATTPNAAAAGTDLQSGYGLGYAQGLQAAPPGAAPTAPPSTKRSATITGDAAGVFVSPTSKSPVIAVLPKGTPATVIGPSVSGETWGGVSYWVPVDYGGQQGYVAGALIRVEQAVGGAIGGAAKSVGSRASWLWHDAHPGIGQSVRMPHYVRAVGGPGNHGREVSRVARRSGVHPARVAMLNPVPTGWIRVA